MSYYKHPTAIVENDKIGDGSKIWHFAHIRKGAIIGQNCNIGKSVYIDTEVKIGDNVKIQNFACIYKGVEIENDIFIGPSVIFTNDLYPRATIWNEDRLIKTTIKKGSSIGANSTIICGIIIGECALVGAGSVVTKDVPKFGLVFGNPARLKGYVCYCGKRLSRLIDTKDEEIDIQDKDEYVIYKCDCGKIVKIRKEDVKKVKT